MKYLQNRINPTNNINYHIKLCVFVLGIVIVIIICTIFLYYLLNTIVILYCRTGLLECGSAVHDDGYIG